MMTGCHQNSDMQLTGEFSGFAGSPGNPALFDEVAVWGHRLEKHEILFMLGGYSFDLGDINADQFGAMLGNVDLDDPEQADAAQAVLWLQNNKDKFIGKIHNPLLMIIDVKNAHINAKYLESTIKVQDLLAFAAENAQDANKLMTELRQNMKLRVNVIQVDPSDEIQSAEFSFSELFNPGN